MARAPALFKKADLKRLIEAARDAGMTPTGVELQPDGTLRVVDQPISQQQTAFDLWEQKL